METAKVDIRKLQFLNDRINQCLDALNQVRLSVHGLSHTGQLGGQGGGAFGIGGGGFGYPQAGIGFPQVGGIGQAGGGIGPLGGISQFGAQGGFPYTGLGHTGPVSPFQQPFGSIGQQFGPQQSPFTQMLGGGVGQQPWGGQSPWLGLSHTSPEIVALTDPFVAVRIAQTFPYAQLPVPPVVSLY